MITQDQQSPLSGERGEAIEEEQRQNGKWVTA